MAGAGRVREKFTERGREKVQRREGKRNKERKERMRKRLNEGASKQDRP